MDGDDLRERTRRLAASSRVFVLGAGFSAAAGIPMIGGLLKLSMRKFNDETPGLYSRLEGYVRTCFALKDDVLDYDKLNFAELCTFLEYVELREYGGQRWSHAGSREKLAFKYYLAKTIAELTPQGNFIPDIYLEFAEQLHEWDRVLVFNWDCLLENALNVLGKRYTYTQEENSIRISKLHGSVNWRLGLPERRWWSDPPLDWRPLGFKEGMMDEEVFFSKQLLDWDTWMRYGAPLQEIEPSLVLPGYGKAFEVRAIAPLWYKPEWAFATTHDVYIIGLSLSPDDFFVRSYFLGTLPHLDEFTGIAGRNLFIINPDLEVRNNYGFLDESENVVFMQEEFREDHIKLMRKRLDESETFI